MKNISNQRESKETKQTNKQTNKQNEIKLLFDLNISLLMTLA